MAGVESTLVWVVLITICCVQGELVNIALRKPASTPSGTYCDQRTRNCWNASKAVDGDNDIHGAYRTCFHSYNHTLSYWTVDLEQEYQLYDIRVYLRSGFVHRIRNTIIYLDNNSSRVCYTFPSNAWTINNPTNASCNKTARYVTLRDPGQLNVCEVEIYVCSNRTYGSNCDRFCHCPHCDRWTGVCSEDCHPGWEGERCDTVNIALRKPTSTPSGTYCDQRTRNCWNASKAVDGDNDIHGAYRTCFHSYNHTLSYWTVDLEQEYQLYDIRVYLRSGFVHRIRNTIIYLDNNSSRVCYTFPSNAWTIHNPTNASCNKTARYVTLRDPGQLNVCEVEIYVCSNRTYGSNCDRFCHCPHCDRWTGVCSEDCHPGWEGERCDTVCSNGTFGYNCSLSCHCPHCDQLTGVCSGDCHPGWKGERCDTACDNHLYGTNCSSACIERHCSGNSSCDHVTGSCDQGCTAGWEDPDCFQACDANTTYGPGCNKSCSDRKCSDNNRSCNRFSGSCDTDCQPGWQGPDCTLPCATNTTYGPGCNQSCDDRKCSDNNRSCNRFNGSCETECQPGWQGPDCTLRCVNTTYGANCKSVCADRHCYGNSPCDHVTGSCDQGCQAGWKGSDCKQVCDKDHYGPSCTEMCATRHCEGESTCNLKTGHCDQGCQTGWTGTDCKDCDSTYYGTNCSYKCGDRHCKERSECNHVTGSCDQGCLDQWQGDDCTQAIPVVYPRDDTPVIAGTVGGVVVILVVVVVIVIFRKRRMRSSEESPSVEMKEGKQNEQANEYAETGSNKKPKESNSATVTSGSDGFPTKSGVPLEEEVEEGEENLGECNNTQQEESPSEPERNYYNLDDMRRGNMIPVSQLESRVREMVESPNKLVEEFKNLPDGFFHPYDESQKPGNKGKNRFKGYYPYNYNRVVLKDSNGDSSGDYINASYLDGYNREKQYIAAQGPYKEDIIEDFVKMIWQEECKVVVMVTGLVESDKIKCLRYWPEEGTSTFGDMSVSMEAQTRFADYTITRLSLQRGKVSRKRHVTHFNYTSWPDHGVPDTSGLLSFMWRVQKTCGQQKHPVVVHCSAGIGRTGTYIAVESLMSQATTEGTVDVVGFVTKMRMQRKNMIQTKEQYLFIYQAVMAAVMSGDTAIDADVIRTRIDLVNLDDVIMGNKTVGQHLQMLETGALRRGPADSITRVPSYQTKSGFFVMLSHPDKERVWNQIYNSDSRTLITWADDDKTESYLPSVDRSVSTSRLTITMTKSSILSESVTHSRICIKLKNGKEDITIHHYHVTGSTRDPSISVLIDRLLLWTTQPARESTTIVSHSISETRLLILLVNITSRLQDDGKVDVISNMRRLQSLLGGPRFTVDDVHVCLELAQRQLDSRSVYANV